MDDRIYMLIPIAIILIGVILRWRTLKDIFHHQKHHEEKNRVSDDS